MDKENNDQQSTLTLLSSVSARIIGLPKDLDESISRASDPSLAIEERLDAYEDIFESEVGDTSLGRAREHRANRWFTSTLFEIRRL